MTLPTDHPGHDFSDGDEYMPQAMGWGLLVRRMKARRGLTEYGHDRFLNLREGQRDRAWITPIYMFCIACFVVWQIIMWGPF